MMTKIDIFIERRMTVDEKYMSRCLRLASKGMYGAAPNPMVGAVIVHEGRIVGEGFHVCCGGPHAEVNAVNAVCDKTVLKKSTLYVSLEPCSHYGKTPPCADLIIKMGIPRVVVGCVDPFSAVSGRGIEKMRAAGIVVVVGVLEKECLALNRKFIVFHQKKRPYITMKWAQSADGYIDRVRKTLSDGPPCALSTPYSQVWMHQVRSLHQAIMVGTNTVLLDNPSLLNRLWTGKSPLRVILDKNGRLPADLKVFTDGSPTLVYVKETAAPSYEATRFVEVVRVGCDFSLSSIMADLYGRNVQSLLVEGGASLLESLIANGMWDEMRVEQSVQYLGEGVPAPNIPMVEPDIVQTLDENKIMTWFCD